MADNDDDDDIIPADSFFPPEPEDADSNISEQKDVTQACDCNFIGVKTDQQ